MRRGWLLALLGLLCAGCAIFQSDATRLKTWQDETVAIRGLPFTQPVTLQWVDEDEMRQVLIAEAGDELDPAKVNAERDALAALGAVEPDLDLAKAMLDLYAAQAAGLYSPSHDTLYVSRKLTGFGALIHPTESLLLTTAIVVHELTHALQDQHFGQVLDLMLSLDDEDDVSRALSGTTEGDATVTMLGAYDAVGHGKREVLAESFRDAMLKELDDPKSEIGKEPRLLAVSLVFPYAFGTVIAARRYDAEGNAGLDEEMSDPPLATLHIMFPGTRGPVDFVRLPVESLHVDAGGHRCTPGYTNVAGAVLLRVLFEKSLDADARDQIVRGWRGDRYQLLDCGAHGELLWLTRWDSHASAERFANAYRALAPGIAARTHLSGAAEVVVRDLTALVVTPGLVPRADALLAASTVKSYESFREWVRDRCFPDDACPARESSSLSAPTARW
jgi:hypothetical protein